jgi:hypothetical protein
MSIKETNTLNDYHLALSSPGEARLQRDFMQWWLTINQILASRGVSEMLYGEAKHYWRELRRE